MFKSMMMGAGLAAVLWLGLSAQDTQTVLSNATKALGSVNSITYSGTSADVNFLQSQDINGPWPMRPMTNYVRTIDLAQPASRATAVTSLPPITGGPGVPGAFNQNITSANAAWAQQLEIYITPWGFLKGAAANNATVKAQKIGGKAYNVATWMTPQKAPSGAAYKVVGYINDQYLVDRVETWVENAVLGDMHVDAAYTDYKDMGGVKVPGKIVQKRFEYPFFEVNVASATPNPSNLTALMTPPPQQNKGKDGKAAGPPPGGAPPAPPAIQAEKLGEGVWRLPGGYVSMAVEYKDYILVLEGGQPEARALAVIAEAKRLIPNKPIRYVFNTHPHSDHSGGLGPFVAEGATIITHQNNKKFLETAFSAPRTLVGDTLAKSPKKPKVMAISDKGQLKDSTRTVEFHYIKDLGHSNGMLIAYLPREKVIFQGDFTLPGAGQATNPFVMTLGQNLDRLKLDYDRYIPVHAPNPDVPWTKADVTKALNNKQN